MTTDPFLSDTSHLTALSAPFVEQLYARWLRDPRSVDESWQQVFAEFGDDAASAERSARGASWGEKANGGLQVDESGRLDSPAPAAKTGKDAAPLSPTKQFTHDSMRALMMIRAYRVRGHLLADLDPLQQEPNKYHPELDPESYGFGPDAMEKEIFLDGVLGLQSATVGQIMQILHQTYCGTIGTEFMHIQFPDQKGWIQERIEGARGVPQLTDKERKQVMRKLIEVEAFENFVQTKFQGMKRFSIQGGDAMLPALEMIVEEASRVGVEEIVIGMPHRGRMNVITAIMGKPYVELLSIFHGNMDYPESIVASGDVKYHLGTSSDREIEGRPMHLSLTANPSHLEIVNPVVVGKVRAKLDQKNDRENKDKAMAVLLHGDAAFAGQGSVPETLSLAELKGYRTGGTVHIVVNNQIGFTTAPKNSRFTPYPTDVAKMIQAPIFHVNGDDADAVAWVCKLATEFRQQFKRDTVVDIFCYRKYGHNEGDEPMFTQPLMYKAIKQKQSPATIYAETLVKTGVMTQDEIDSTFAEFKERFEKDFDVAKGFAPNKADWLEGKWSGYVRPQIGSVHPLPDTGVALEKLKAYGNKLAEYPEGFNLNAKIVRQLEAKREMMSSGENIDWAMGEALAFATLLTEGHRVRLSGQDSERGTFSHRHSVFTDQENESQYTPLNHVAEGQAEYEVINSSLSELAVLGFEYGYSQADPNALVCWEAQFGDFVNGAQMVIDQFICSGEIKWLRMNGLVMLLPHGFEGQGPEHSSARLERFLQLCGEDNMVVANTTTPANYFHILRRQLHLPFRKPLVLMTPKSLLRHKLAVSSLKDFAPGTTFQRVLPEIDKLDAKKVKRLILTSGKVYYDILEARRERKMDDVAIVRVEQYYPFPVAELTEQLKLYPNAEVLWCQEEPENMGAFRFVEAKLRHVLDGLKRTSDRLLYAGRPEAASPATGFAKVHEAQQKAVVEAALALDSRSKKKVA